MTGDRASRPPSRLSPDVQRAYDLLDAGRVDDALASARRVQAERPDALDALVVLGNVLAEAGQDAEAADVLERARARCDEDAQTLPIDTLLASLYDDLDRPEDALEACGRVLCRDPTRTHVGLLFACLLDDAGRTDEAMRAFAWVKTIDPGAIPPEIDEALARWRGGAGDDPGTIRGQSPDLRTKPGDRHPVSREKPGVCPPGIGDCPSTVRRD